VAALSVSCFGKLPFHREFLRVGLGTPAAAWVVGWVEGAHAAWNAHGDAPADTPLVRFAAPVEGGGLVAGVVRQSSDGLRRHPVTFFVEDPHGAGRDDWHLLPLAFATQWTELAALSARPWNDLGSLTAALAAGVPPPDWPAARVTRRDALAAPISGSPWEALAGAGGDTARHMAVNLLVVAEAQREARSPAEGVSVALPLPSDPALGASRAGFWLDLLDVAVGGAANPPVIVLGDAPPRLVVFYRPPEGPDLAAVLSSLDMAPIDDVAEPWQVLPAAGSERARTVDSIVAHATPGTLGDILARFRSVANT
jgi:hypothetical protein